MTTPATVDGTGASTLSVDISTRSWPSATVSPTCTSHSRTMPSLTDSPTVGISI